MSVKEVADSAELRRRIRRLLAAIRSIATDMQLHGRDAQDSARHFADRVGALGRAATASISNGIDLESLVRDELLAHGVTRDVVMVDGPGILLNAKSAEMMILVVHELTANAIKFGALSQPQAQLRVVWWLTASARPRLRFEWMEKGVRMGPAEGYSAGFGSLVVNRLVARELKGDGKMVFLPEGVLCTIEIPSVEALQSNE